MRAVTRACTIACLILLAGGRPAGRAWAQGAGDKHALLIGVRHYPKGELRNLEYTEADVEGLAAVLAESGYRKENILVLTQKAAAADPSRNPTLANIRAALKRWLKERRETDSLLVAFAGHGVQFRGAKEQFFCPADARVADPQNTLLPLSEVCAQLQKCRSDFKVLLVDACRNDPLADMSRGGNGRSGDSKPPTVKLDSAFRPDTASEGGVAAICSCSRGEKAYEHDGLKHSVFFHFVIKGLQGDADQNRDGKVTLLELLEYVQHHVPKFTRREFQVRQLPELHLPGGTLRGALPLALLKRPAPERPSQQLQPSRPAAQLHALTAHTGRVWAVALSPDGRLAASASGDQTVRLWDTATGQGVRTLIGHAGEVEAVAFSASGTKLASGGEDKLLRVWETATGKELYRLSGHTGVVRCVAFSDDGKWAVSGAVDRTVRLWELATGKQRWRFDGHTESVYAVAISPDGWRILSGGHDGTVRYWAIEKGKEEFRMTHAKIVYGVAISPDGKLGLSGSADHTMRLWNLETGAELRRCSHPDEVNGVAFSPDGRFAISGCDDGRVRLWEVASGQLLERFEGHKALVYSVAYARNGRTAVSGSFDKTARLWNLRGTAAAPPLPPEPPAVFLDRADLQVSVTWNTSTDVDLHVIEPDGTKCFYGHRRTENGGHLLKDVVDGTTGPEQYQAVQTIRGTYRIKLHYYSGPTKDQQQPTRGTVVLRRFVGTPQATTQQYPFTLTRKDEIIDICTVGF